MSANFGSYYRRALESLYASVTNTAFNMALAPLMNYLKWLRDRDLDTAIYRITEIRKQMKKARDINSAIMCFLPLYTMFHEDSGETSASFMAKLTTAASQFVFTLGAEKAINVLKKEISAFRNALLIERYGVDFIGEYEEKISRKVLSRQPEGSRDIYKVNKYEIEYVNAKLNELYEDTIKYANLENPQVRNSLLWLAARLEKWMDVAKLIPLASNVDARSHVGPFNRITVATIIAHKAGANPNLWKLVEMLVEQGADLNYSNVRKDGFNQAWVNLFVPGFYYQTALEKALLDNGERACIAVIKKDIDGILSAILAWQDPNIPNNNGMNILRSLHNDPNYRLEADFLNFVLLQLKANNPQLHYILDMAAKLTNGRQMLENAIKSSIDNAIKSNPIMELLMQYEPTVITRYLTDVSSHPEAACCALNFTQMLEPVYISTEERDDWITQNPQENIPWAYDRASLNKWIHTVRINRETGLAALPTDPQTGAELHPGSYALKPAPKAAMEKIVAAMKPILNDMQAAYRREVTQPAQAAPSERTEPVTGARRRSWWHKT